MILFYWFCSKDLSKVFLGKTDFIIIVHKISKSIYSGHLFFFFCILLLLVRCSIPFPITCLLRHCLCCLYSGTAIEINKIYNRETSIGNNLHRFFKIGAFINGIFKEFIHLNIFFCWFLKHVWCDCIKWWNSLGEFIYSFEVT